MRESKFIFRVIITLAIWLIANTTPSSGDEIWNKRWSIGVQSGYVLSMGDWNKHIYADGVNQFNTDFSMSLEISVRTARDVNLSLHAIYLRLNTGEWEDYVSSTGDRLTAKAGCWISPLAIHYAIYRDIRNQLSILGGMGLAFSSGQETYNGISYHYDFLRGADFVFMTGFDYNLMISEPVALSLRSILILIPSGINYADREGQTIVALPITAGLKIYWY